MAADEDAQSVTNGGIFHTVLVAQSEKHEALKPLTAYTEAWGKDPLKNPNGFEDTTEPFCLLLRALNLISGALTVSKAFCPMAPGALVAAKS